MREDGGRCRSCGSGLWSAEKGVGDESYLGGGGSFRSPQLRVPRVLREDWTAVVNMGAKVRVAGGWMVGENLGEY
jgi:hypothetical protein